MDCGSQEEIVETLLIVETFIPLVYLILIIFVYAVGHAINEYRLKLFKEDGTIEFDDNDFELFDFCKAYYFFVFSLVVLNCVLIAVISHDNKDKDCDSNGWVLQYNMFFLVYVIISYMLYHVDQFKLNNILDPDGESESHLTSAKRSASTDVLRCTCKSYIRSLMAEEPTILFKYKEWTRGNDFEQEVVHVDESERFHFNKWEDMTDPKQLKGIEKVINNRKPVILKTTVSIVCGNAQIKDEFQKSWENFYGEDKRRKLGNENYKSKTLKSQIYTYRCKKGILLFWDKPGKLPYWMNETVYFICVTFLLALPYKLLFWFATQRVTLHIRKVIY